MEQFVEIFKMYSIISAFKGIPDIREVKDKGFSRHTNDCFLFLVTFLPRRDQILHRGIRDYIFSINWFVITGEKNWWNITRKGCRVTTGEGK